MAIVLPSLDPNEKFKGVVEELIGSGFEHIVVSTTAAMRSICTGSRRLPRMSSVLY